MKDLKQNYPTMFTAYKDVVNVQQLAEMLGIGINLAYRLVKQNTIKSIKVGRQYKIPKQNIISYLVGTYQGNNQLTLYKFKADSNVLGIMQLDNQIGLNENISKELETINVTGSKLVKEMYMIPIDNTILYIEPIYQLALNSETQIPTLKKVIVASGNRVAIGDTVKKAIDHLLSQDSSKIDVQNSDTEEGLVNEIIKANSNLQNSSNTNNWELVGKDLAKLQDLINQLQKLKEDEKSNNETNETSYSLTNEIDVNGNVLENKAIEE